MQNPVTTILGLIVFPLLLSLVAGLAAWWRAAPAASAARPSAPALRPPDDLPPFERRGPVAALALTTLVGLTGGAAIAGLINLAAPFTLPARAQEWLPFILAGAGLVGLFEALARPYWVIAWVLRIAVLSAAIWLPILPAIREGFGPFGQYLTFAGALGAGGVTWWGFDRAARARGPVGALLVVLVCTCASLSFVLTGHVLPAVVCGGLCAAVGPGAVIGFLRPGFTLGPAVATPAVMLGAYFLHTHAVLGETPLWCGVLLAASAALGGAMLRPDAPARPGIRAFVLPLALAALPGLASVAIGLIRTLSGGAESTPAW